MATMTMHKRSRMSRRTPAAPPTAPPTRAKSIPFTADVKNRTIITEIHDVSVRRALEVHTVVTVKSFEQTLCRG